MRISTARSSFWCIACSLAIMASGLMPLVCWAQSPDVVRVEEDWELVIGVPSPDADAPQVACLISPVGNVDAQYATFIVNHHDVPSFTAGGLQLQAWEGSNLVASKRHPDQAVLTTPGEVITWTQAMSRDTEGLTFDVINGVSTTWGPFGNDGTLKIIVPTALQNLNGYDPAVSVQHSGISYAANRVQSLVLKRVRTYSSTGLIAEDANPRVVHSSTD